MPIMSNAYDTPMMKQHSEIKKKYPDAYLFFRCGDFYELFGNDALEASRILDITLTKRQNDIPMCGVPYHAVDVYVARLIKAGKKIAICEQLEDPKSVKGIVKRGVSEIITPGTLVEEKHLGTKYNNFLLALNIKGLFIEISTIDISTGDFEFNELSYTEDLSLLRGEMVRLSPREVIIPESIYAAYDNIREIFGENENVLVNRYPDWYFDPAESNEIILSHFKVASISELGIKNINTDFTTPGILLKYASENSQNSLSHIKTITFPASDNTMALDEGTVRNLELLKNQMDGTVNNSLLDIIDETQTAMGGRLLKKWIIAPLKNKRLIEERLDVVTHFLKNRDVMERLLECVRNIQDLERLCGRIVMDKANPKDLVAIKNSLESCCAIKDTINGIGVFDNLYHKITELKELSGLIESAIKDEPATLTDDGNIVREGYNKELDELKELAKNSKEIMFNIEAELKKKFNVPSLKIKYNKIIGYFFEVSKMQSVNLDNSFILKQSLVTGMRYTNKELSEYESKILSAGERINEIERGIFNDIKERVFDHIAAIQRNAEAVSIIDVLLSFARTALNNRYTRPVINDNYSLNISEGRHPVVEKKLTDCDFIPNDTILNEDGFIVILTGPNMSGKSTYLRQTAIIVLLAQIGSYVPAGKAEIGIVDRIFTRIGSSDNLARGQSTFLVEMQETANILKHATKESLIIMDEIGRGTSTYDGLSIAWSIIEYLSSFTIPGPKTLFATHYHELTRLDVKRGIKNGSVAVNEMNGKIVFLHKITDKPAEKSYGIHVAGIAGLPPEVIDYAGKILDKLEDKSDDGVITGKLDQLELFSISDSGKKEINPHAKEIIDLIKYLDIDRISPIQALNMINDVKKKIAKAGL